MNVDDMLSSGGNELDDYGSMVEMILLDSTVSRTSTEAAPLDADGEVDERKALAPEQQRIRRGGGRAVAPAAAAAGGNARPPPRRRVGQPQFTAEQIRLNQERRGQLDENADDMKAVHKWDTGTWRWLVQRLLLWSACGFLWITLLNWRNFADPAFEFMLRSKSTVNELKTEREAAVAMRRCKVDTMAVSGTIWKSGAQKGLETLGLAGSNATVQLTWSPKVDEGGVATCATMKAGGHCVSSKCAIHAAAHAV